MKRIMFVMVMLIAMIVTTTAFAIEGEGTEKSPFLITTSDELELLSDFPDCYFNLMNDIECSKSWNYNIMFTGVFNGNNHTISNFSGKSFVSSNEGTIKNLNLSASCSDRSIIVGYNYPTGVIINCSAFGILNSSGRCAGIATYNYGTITKCKNYAKINSNTSGGNNNHSSSTTTSYSAAFVYLNGGIITDSFAICDVIAHAYSYYWDSDAYACGFIYSNSGEVTNCFAATTTTSTKAEGYSGKQNSFKSAFIYTNTGNVSNCFYDNTVNTLTTSLSGVTKKTTLAMKMKKTYTDAGWDFDTVWGISADINDGYPYLLWEYENDSSTNVEIIGTTSTDNSLKFISEVSIEGEPEISAFGTAFIPLWLFESGSADIATVSYDNSNYNISNAQTFGATLTDIPESCKDMGIVGKSFIKDTDGNYEWSTAKYASVNNTILNALE